MKPKTRLGLYYLVTYLFVTGVGLLFAPQLSLGLLMSNGHYDNTFVQFTGTFMIGLGMLVAQMVRYRVEVLYPTTLFVRAFFIAVIVVLYRQTNDPAFLLVLGVVAFGVALTTTALLLDRRAGQYRRPMQAVVA
ncbi:MAG: hypothetical protein WCV99_09305 [Sterolibacterium sp.]|jgi:hypothetical protein